MSDELPPLNDALTDAELDAVVGGGADSTTHWGCGLLKTLGDSTHSGQSPGHLNSAGTKRCDGRIGYTLAPENACPHPDTPILVSATGETRRAGDLGVGDWIFTRHQHRDEWAQYQVAQAEPRQQPCARVDFESGRTVVVSMSHRFLMAPPAEVHTPTYAGEVPAAGYVDGSHDIFGVALLDAPRVDRWIRVSALTVGTAIKGWQTVDLVAGINDIGMGPVVRFEITDAHTYVADGLLSHNSPFKA